jgi:hypothetical protein
MKSWLLLSCIRELAMMMAQDEGTAGPKASLDLSHDEGQGAIVEIVKHFRNDDGIVGRSGKTAGQGQVMQLNPRKAAHGLVGAAKRGFRSIAGIER